LDAIWLACGGVGASGNNIAGSRWKLKFLVASANRSGMPPLFWKLGPWKVHLPSLCKYWKSDCKKPDCKKPG